MSHALYQLWQIASLGTVPDGKFLLLEMGVLILALVNCAFWDLHMCIATA
jgi:hypothetical protein